MGCPHIVEATFEREEEEVDGVGISRGKHATPAVEYDRRMRGGQRRQQTAQQDNASTLRHTTVALGTPPEAMEGKERAVFPSSSTVFRCPDECRHHILSSTTDRCGGDTRGHTERTSSFRTAPSALSCAASMPETKAEAIGEEATEGHAHNRTR